MLSKDMVSQETKHHIIRETVLYSGSQYAAEGISAVRGIIIAFILGPSYYGVWSILKTILAGSELMGWGATQGMSREVPYRRGKHQQRVCRVIQQTSLTWGIIISAVIAAGMVIVSFSTRATSYRSEIRLAALAFIGTFLYYWIRLKLRGENKIDAIIKCQLLHVAINTVVGIGFLFFFKINGLLVGLIVSYILVFSYLYRLGEWVPPYDLQKRVLWQLLRSGFPIMMLSVTIFFMYRMDNLFVFFLLGKHMAGYYGLASFICLVISYIPISMTTVLFPKMLYRFGETDDRGKIEAYFKKPIIFLSLFMTILLGCFFITIDVPVYFILKEYIPAIQSLKILILSLFFASVMKIPNAIIITFNKQLKLMVINIFILSLGASLDYAAIYFGYGISGVAYATGFVFFLICSASTLYSLYSLRKTLEEGGKILARVYGPFVYCLISLSIVYNVFPIELPLTTLCLVRMVLFLFLMTPIIYLLNKEQSLYEIMIVIFNKNPSQSKR